MRRGWVTGTLIVAAGLALWEVGVSVTSTPVYLLPAPSDVASQLSGDLGVLVPAAGVTLIEGVGGLILGGGIGLLLAMVITLWGRLEQGVMSVALFVKSTPIIAVTPILTIWMGFGAGPKVAVVALLTFFPVLINALEGFRSVDPAIADWFHSIDAPAQQYFTQARWPSARPYLFAALKVVAPLSLIGAVVAEWMGASSGLGRKMWLAYTSFDMPSLFAAVIVLTLLSASLYRLVVVAEKHSLYWTTT